MKAAALLVVLVVLLAAPAHAAQVTSPDQEGDLDHVTDLTRVKVLHSGRIRVTVWHQNLRPAPARAAGLTLYLDTDPLLEGPEYIFGTGLLDGTDYLLSDAEGWQPDNGVNCDYDLTLDYEAEATRMWFERGCFDSPAAVRVAFKVGAEARDGSTIIDWHKYRRHFTRWIAQY